LIITCASAAAGFFLVIYGSSIIPMNNPIMDSNNRPYTPEEQNENYRQLVLQSLGFKLIIVGASIVVALFISIFLYLWCQSAKIAAEPLSTNYQAEPV